MTPHYIHIDQAGDKYYYSDKAMKVLHRKDGPAIERANGTRLWYRNNVLHRLDGPAIDGAGKAGNKAWYLYGKLHRKGGPAIEWSGGVKEWWYEGKLHREDGPAIEGRFGTRQYFLNDQLLSEDQFNAKMNPVTELTLDEIAAKFGISVTNLKIKK